MHNLLNKTTNKATKASVLAIILLISVAIPLLILPANAAATVSLSPTSGPDGTAVKVTGSGFGVSESVSAFTVTVDGLSGKVITGAPLSGSNQLATTSAGALSGYIIIGGIGGLSLAVGTHSVQISDATAAPPAASFAITAPTVTVTPSTGPAGTSVVVTASGFPAKSGTVYTPSPSIASASFAGNPVPVVGAGVTITALPGTLSSSVVSTTGTYSGTVSLPATSPTGSSFTLTDNFGNVATTTFALNTPTVTFSPASGPVGTLVTVSASGFGPGAVFSNADTTNPVKFGTTANGLTTGSSVNHLGQAVFQFTVGAGSPDYAAGIHTVIITDSLNNFATQTFTVTPSATITLGSAAVNSGSTYAPTGATAALYVSVAGFAPSTKLTLTGSAGTPTNWLTGYTAASITTNANGAIVLATSTTAAAPGAGQYLITITDGVNSQTVLLTIASSASFFYVSPTSAAVGSLVSVYAYDAAGGTAITAVTFGGSPVLFAAGSGTAIWPAAVTTPATFSVPAAGAGLKVVGVTTTLATLPTVGFTATSGTVLSIVIPSSVPAGGVITIAGSGFESVPVTPALTMFVDGTTVVPTLAVLTSGILMAQFSAPNLLAGAHTIMVSDPAGNTATGSFIIATPTILVSPSSGPAGTTISVTGSGFHAGEAISATFDGGAMFSAATIGLTTINTNGQILLYQGTIIPKTNLPAGAHTITVGGTTPGNAATFTFTVTPTLTLTPSAVRPGAYSVVTGASFTASATLTVTLSGTAVQWYNPATTANTTTITTDAFGNIPANAAVVVTPTTAPGTLVVTVIDSSAVTQSANLTVLATPAITLNPTQVVSGSAAPISISGTGFSVGSSRAASAVLSLSGTAISGAIIGLTATVTVSGTGAFPTGGATVTFTVISGLAAGSYTFTLTLGALAGTPPVPAETATATLTVLGAPSVSTTPTTANIQGNVSITISGLAPASNGATPPAYPITAATIGATSILSALNNINVPTSGTSAYVLTTWFLVPTGITGGTYTLTVGDGTRSANTLITIAAAITLTPTTGILKGSTVNIAGTGFGVLGTAYTVTVNGVPIASAAGTTGAGGAVTTSFAVPVTATATNTVVVTDTLGNTATATFNLTAPSILLNPTSGTVGSTVQILGSGFTPGSSVVIEVGTSIVNTAPPSVSVSSGGAFIAYVAVPAGLSGNVTITAIDSSNNVAMSTFAVTSGGATGFTVNQAALSSTAQTLNNAGTPQTSFAAGAAVKFSFVLSTTAGSGSVVWAITIQQGTTVYNIVNVPTSVSTTPATITFQQLIPASAAPGSWTATVQIYASDGVTALGVTTLTFTVHS